jgi:hypothetical protein
MGTCAVEPRVAGHLRVMLLAQMFNNAQRRSLCCCNRHAAWRRISQAQRPVRASPGVSRPLLVCTAAEAVMGDKPYFEPWESSCIQFVHKRFLRIDRSRGPGRDQCLRRRSPAAHPECLHILSPESYLPHNKRCTQDCPPTPSTRTTSTTTTTGLTRTTTTTSVPATTNTSSPSTTTPDTPSTQATHTC